MSVTREQIVRELWSDALNRALIAAQSRSRRPEPMTGTDGEQTCQSCAPLAEHTKTDKARLELLRRGPVPAAEALAIDHLVSVSYNARARGEEVVSLYVPADAKSAGVGPRTLTRALRQVRRWQDDPETASALSFRIEDEYRGGKHYVRLRALSAEAEDGTVRTKRDEYLAISRLPRDEGRAQHGGARLACPKHPDAPLARTRIWSCTEEDCTWVYQDTATIGDRRQDGAGEVGEVGEIHGAPFVTTVQALEDDVSRQDGAGEGLRTYQRQDGAGGGLVPVSFVSPDDLAWASGPTYQGESPPDDPPEPPAWQPPPVAPRSQLAWWARQGAHGPPAAIAGGSE